MLPVDILEFDLIVQGGKHISDPMLVETNVIFVFHADDEGLQDLYSRNFVMGEF